ncbi:MAG: ribulose-phosphate 3-epimerase [Eubacteriales bacterium]|nr:ribulose-phosphate 3-epimerase [Eubacteriales bacterium]
MSKLAPSILSADFTKLGDQVKEASEAGADLIHFDVMDGHFVPNISFGPVVLKNLLKVDSAPFDVHLMIEDPDRYIDSFVTDKTEYITVHYEACPHIYRTLEHIKSKGIKAGVAIDPGTPIEALNSVMDLADMILVMTVEPGFGGQKFIPMTLKKVQKLAGYRNRHGHSFEIEVDGGANLDNVTSLYEAGADIIVAGSAVFGGDSITENVHEFLKRIKYSVDEKQINNLK